LTQRPPFVFDLPRDLQEPKGCPVDEVRATGDDIARRVDGLVAELHQQHAA
jgi:hypothetical protein